MIKTRNLKDVLVEMMMLTEKYGFNPEDKRFMMEKCILLGEATSCLLDLGLLEEYQETGNIDLSEPKCSKMIVFPSS